MDTFDASRVEALLASLRRALGPEIPKVTAEPDSPNRFRGGPYLLGGIHRRAWNVRWENLPATMRRSLDANDLGRVKAHPAELIVQWADHLPFAVLLIRAPPGPAAQWVAYAAESLLDDLPGRLGPTNRMPRSESQLVIYAKITDERMDRIREAMQQGRQDEALRRDLAEGLPHIGNASGNLHLESLASNVLHIEGEGSPFLGDDKGPQGPLRAFVYSNGNLGPHEGWEWHIPMWIPPGPGSSTWTDFNFHPFLVAATRNALHVGVEAGVIDEALSEASRNLPGGDAAGPANSRLPDLHRELVALHTRLQGLATTLHLGSTRSPIAPQTEDWRPGRLRYDAADDQGWPNLRPASASSDALKALKSQAEQDALQVLEGLERRLDRALDLVTSVENQGLTRSMRRWTIATSVLAFVAILVAVVSFVAR
jgi:hypothetical protein